ncbi:MAG: hypothetical protein WDA27_13140 [Actinomycetota bacterium]
MSLPKLTVGPERNPVPEIVTARFDAPWPIVFGFTPLTVGNGLTVKHATQVDDPASPVFVTVMSPAPEVASEATLIATVICVALFTVVVLTVIFGFENTTVVPVGGAKPVPVITMLWFDAPLPREFGLAEVTVGGVATVKQPAHVPTPPSGFVTTMSRAPAAAVEEMVIVAMA